MVRKKKGDQSTEQASEATATESQAEAFEIVLEDPLEIERLRNEDLVERLKDSRQISRTTRSGLRADMRRSRNSPARVSCSKL